MFISILGNALVLAAIIKTPSIRSTSMIMLCSLAVSVLFIGLVDLPIYAAKDVTKDLLLHNVAETIAYSLCGILIIIFGASFTTITDIAVDRFLAHGTFRSSVTH